MAARSSHGPRRVMARPPARLPARPGARPRARRSTRQSGAIPRWSAVCGAAKNLRSPRHPEDGS